MTTAARGDKEEKGENIGGRGDTEGMSEKDRYATFEKSVLVLFLL